MTEKIYNNYRTIARLRLVDNIDDLLVDDQMIEELADELLEADLEQIM